MHYYESVLEAIGRTPLVRLRRIEERFYLHFALYGKLERSNPSGSIKDRAALAIMKDAKKKGLIKDSTTVIEATSGNMGISLAMICSVYKLAFHVYMPASSSNERVEMMKAFGAEVFLTPAEEGMEGAKNAALEEKARTKDCFMPSQFDNPSNWRAHIVTGNEIYDDLEGDISAVVCGIGTGGTITGIAKVMDRLAVNASIVGVEPASDPFVSKHQFGTHKIQGIGPNFVPSILEENLIHQMVQVTDEDAYEMTKILAKEEGIFAGISSGAALYAAVKLDLRHHKNGNVVVVLPDSGERYLTTEGLFHD